MVARGLELGEETLGRGEDTGWSCPPWSPTGGLDEAWGLLLFSLGDELGLARLRKERQMTQPVALVPHCPPRISFLWPL